MTKLLTVLLNYKSRLQLIYMDDSIIRVRLNVHKALVENETEKKIILLWRVDIISITSHLLTVGHRHAVV